MRSLGQNLQKLQSTVQLAYISIHSLTHADVSWTWLAYPCALRPDSARLTKECSGLFFFLMPGALAYIGSSHFTKQLCDLTESWPCSPWSWFKIVGVDIFQWLWIFRREGWIINNDDSCVCACMCVCHSVQYWAFHYLLHLDSEFRWRPLRRARNGGEASRTPLLQSFPPFQPDGLDQVWSAYSAATRQGFPWLFA